MLNFNDLAFSYKERTDDEIREEKIMYDNFLNFLTDIIVKYGVVNV